MKTDLSNTNIYYFVCWSGSLQAVVGVNSVDEDASFSPCFWSGHPQKAQEKGCNQGRQKKLLSKDIWVKVEYSQRSLWVKDSQGHVFQYWVTVTW